MSGEGSRAFELWVERRTWQLRLYLESGQNEQAIQELIEMIRYNYTQVEEDFQSIYNLHEVLISMALPMVPAIKNKTLSLAQLAELTSTAGASEQSLFADFVASDELIKNLNASFAHYASQFVGVKSVNALNCRKSALLSQMLLRHKAIAFTNLEEARTTQATGPIFNDLILEYSKIFASTQTLCFDLAPYLTYLPEYKNSAVQSPLLNYFAE